MPDLGPDAAPCRHAYAFKITGAELLPEKEEAAKSEEPSRRISQGPLRVHPKNPRYFTDGSGKAIYLTGSHTWSNLQDQGAKDPPPKFDYDRYLDFLRKAQPQLHSHVGVGASALGAVVRWKGEEWRKDPGDWFIEPNPYARTGPGMARDGKPKFDLSKFDPAYFDRLRERVQKAGERGIYVSVMLFQGWSSAKGWGYGGEPWLGHPYHPDNNVQAFNGNLKSDAGPDLNDPQVRERQAAYLRKVVDTVNDLDNVLYEVTNEGGNKDWDWWVVRTVQEYEKTKAKQHPVGLTGHGSESNEEMLASPADWISPGSDGWQDLKTDPRSAPATKVSLLDTDHVFGVGGDQKWVWKAFLRGHNVLFMDPYDDPQWVADPGGPEGRRARRRRPAPGDGPHTALCGADEPGRVDAPARTGLHRLLPRQSRQGVSGLSARRRRGQGGPLRSEREILGRVDAPDHGEDHTWRRLGRRQVAIA